MEYFLIPPYCALLLLGLGDVAALIVVNGILGRSVILNSQYEIPASSFIQWNYNSLLVAQYYNSSSLCTGQLTGRCQVYGNGSLRIDNLSYADQGDYTLNTQILGSSTFNSTNYQLTVYISRGGLNGGDIAGIVVGVLAGVTIIGVIVFLILKKKNPPGTGCDIPHSAQANIYEIRLPGVQVDTAPTVKEESHYQHLKHPDLSVYQTMRPVPAK
ncbi:uncharacterized protein [Dendropsophus ebraccatus]|uniref:uncharacterized protein n=1 Tax=Dendropsophus ebraccatus TaxID=150705 RepID=UPI003831FF4E